MSDNPTPEKFLQTSKEPMSDSQVHHYLPNTRIITYEELANYDSILDVLPKKKDQIILMFQRVKNDGHWCSLNREENKIIFFDPYGYRPDRQLLWTKQTLRRSLGQDVPHLSILLNKAVDDGLRVVFNEYPFQDRDKLEYATCGRWCCAQCLYFQRRKHPTIKGFYQLIMKLCKVYKLVPDIIVSALIP
jgi:hypothetical protein